MSKEEVIIRFDEVSFAYSEKKPILDEVSFSIRKNSKVTIMGQNGAGKSTIFKLITKELRPQKGEIHIDTNAKIAIAEQILHAKFNDHTLLKYFETAFDEKIYGIEKNIISVLKTVGLAMPIDTKIKRLSGGQKARLLVAFALVQNPDILLLDEPTNNLDKEGYEALIQFLIMYDKTCIVISHDADFLNTFTDGVLNLDVHTHKVEQFVGNYYDVVEQIKAQIERERLLNARIVKSVKDRFEKVNKLGGKSVAMRRLARKVRQDIVEDREKMVDIRQEDRTISEFCIPTQSLTNPVVQIDKVQIIKEGEVVTKNVTIDINRDRNLLIKGPNGIGKSTLLGSFLRGYGIKIRSDARIGYYSQDFSELNFEDTAYNSLCEVANDKKQQEIYNAAGRFLLTGDLLHHKIGSLSEGQKGLLCYARFMVQEPGVLIMDEPTNHINFRHIPIIAKALDEYEGALILVSHMNDFLSQITIDDELDLTKI